MSNETGQAFIFAVHVRDTHFLGVWVSVAENPCDSVSFAHMDKFTVQLVCVFFTHSQWFLVHSLKTVYMAFWWHLQNQYLVLLQKDKFNEIF